MPDLIGQLALEKCPHCGIDKPNLRQRNQFQTTDYTGETERWWKTYVCLRCGGAVLAASTESETGEIAQIYPQASEPAEAIPQRVREYLRQAADSLHSPVGSIAVCRSAVDAMLQNHGYRDGSLYSRIDRAKDENLITDGMADWAHNIKFDANDQSRADEDAPLPTPDDAARCLDFAQALGEFLFVLPDRVRRGVTASTVASEGQG